jgi:hypothetical protein
MPRPGPQTQAKRRRELARLEKRRAKEERRALRKSQKAMDSEASTEIPPIEPDAADTK